jgi:hypothetical protein
MKGEDAEEELPPAPNPFLGQWNIPRFPGPEGRKQRWCLGKKKEL